MANNMSEFEKALFYLDSRNFPSILEHRTHIFYEEDGYQTESEILAKIDGIDKPLTMRLSYGELTILQDYMHHDPYVYETLGKIRDEALDDLHYHLNETNQEQKPYTNITH